MYICFYVTKLFLILPCIMYELLANICTRKIKTKKKLHIYVYRYTYVNISHSANIIYLPNCSRIVVIFIYKVITTNTFTHSCRSFLSLYVVFLFVYLLTHNSNINYFFSFYEFFRLGCVVL